MPRYTFFRNGIEIETRTGENAGEALRNRFEAAHLTFVAPGKQPYEGECCIITEFEDHAAGDSCVNGVDYRWEVKAAEVMEY